jgi:hypothetical protein
VGVGVKPEVIVEWFEQNAFGPSGFKWLEMPQGDETA